MDTFEARQPWPRGIGVGWGRGPSQDTISRVQHILSSTDGEEHDRLAAAMMHLFGTGDPKKWLPDGTKRRVSLDEKVTSIKANNAAAQQATLEQLRKNRDVIKGVRILAALNSCDYCKAHAGDFTFDNVPPLPHKACTHHYGCRCTYTAITKEWDELLGEPIKAKAAKKPSERIEPEKPKGFLQRIIEIIRPQ